MLVICEDCAKKYHIDESRITAAKAKFPCKACGHIIVVERPEAKPGELLALEAPVAAESGGAEKAPKRKAAAAGDAAGAGTAASLGRGRPAALYLLAAMIVGLVTVSCVFSLLYFNYVSALVNRHMELHGLALAIALKERIRVPLQQKNDDEVNQAVRLTGKLPGVAYAAVTNEKGVVVAYAFNTLNDFEERFSQRVKDKGFPADILAQNGLEKKNVRINVGGLPVYDRMLPLPDVGGEVHVGIPAAKADSEIRNALFSPLLFAPLGLAVVFMAALLLLVEQLIIRPLRSLTVTANRISLGEMDLAIAPRGSRELRELATALKRMRHSVKTAVEKSGQPPAV